MAKIIAWKRPGTPDGEARGEKPCASSAGAACATAMQSAITTSVSKTRKASAPSDEGWMPR